MPGGVDGLRKGRRTQEVADARAGGNLQAREPFEIQVEFLESKIEKTLSLVSGR